VKSPLIGFAAEKKPKYAREIGEDEARISNQKIIKPAPLG